MKTEAELTELQTIALRHGNLYLPEEAASPDISPASAALAESLREHGYTLSEAALHAVNALSEGEVQKIVHAIENVYGSRLNWASLIKGWQTPTGETWADHVVGYFANAFPEGFVKGTKLPCGHVIPSGLFDLSRYNGCPLCGTPFVLADKVNTGGTKPSKVLGRMTDADMERLMRNIMASPLPPSPTEVASLTTLAEIYGIPADATFGNNETRIILSANLFTASRFDEALQILTDVPMLMRMLWYKQTGMTRIIKKFGNPACKLHFSRTQCKAVALRLDAMSADAPTVCEQMNPCREMWVRFIRALRLTEYARRLKLTNLQNLLDVFYREDYSTWAGEVEAATISGDHAALLALLCERPSVFARSLFSAMLIAGVEATMLAFRTVSDKISPRLMCSLAGAAPVWFGEGDKRSIALADGRRVSIDANPHLSALPTDQREKCIMAVKNLARDYFTDFYAAKGPLDETFFIAEALMEIPMPVGDRGITVSSDATALQGQRFKVQGDAVRLFLQWGEGLPAQHLDMDLSAKILYADGSTADCAYYNLYVGGATHSGDIQHIPDNVGTAEYIELELPKLAADKARYVIFACNAYSSDTLSPNLRVGWMSCENPMTVDDNTGVAYDPSTVQHIVTVNANPSRGLVFGILDVADRTITWLEIPNSTQRMEQFDAAGAEAYLRKLREKMTIGELLQVYTAARRCKTTADKAAADKVLDIRWTASGEPAAMLL